MFAGHEEGKWKLGEDIWGRETVPLRESAENWSRMLEPRMGIGIVEVGVYGVEYEMSGVSEVATCHVVI